MLVSLNSDSSQSHFLRTVCNFRGSAAIMFSLLLSGCASTYHPLQLDNLVYSPGDTIKGISYGYRYNILKEQGNKKYARKELEKNIKFVAFTFTNSSLKPINLVNDLEYYQYGTRKINPLDPNSIENAFEQDPDKYYADLWLMICNGYGVQSSTSGSNTSSHFIFIPIGIIIGPEMTIVNISIAKKANLLFGKDLDIFTPFSIIMPGQKTFVLISFGDISERPIRIRLKGKSESK